MAQDIARGMPTEIDNINGAIVRSGEKWGVATPVNLALLQLVNRQILMGDWRPEVDRLPDDLQGPFTILARVEPH
jgi:2-dehydropantoate 2-reductase